MDDIAKFVVQWASAGGRTNNLYASYVRAGRHKVKMTRKDLAEQLGIPNARLVLIENGLIDVEAIPAAMTAQLGVIFGIRLADFITLLEDLDLPPEG